MENKEDIHGWNKVLPSWSPYHVAQLHLNEIPAMPQQMQNDGSPQRPNSRSRLLTQCQLFFKRKFRRKSKQDLRCRMMGPSRVPIRESDCRLHANWDWVASQDLDFNIPNWKIRLWYNFYNIVELPLFKNYTFNPLAIFAINLERLWQCASMIYHQSVQRNALLLHFKPQFQPKQGPTPCAKLAPNVNMKYSGIMSLSYKRKT